MSNKKLTKAEQEKLLRATAWAFYAIVCGVIAFICLAVSSYQFLSTKSNSGMTLMIIGLVALFCHYACRVTSKHYNPDIWKKK